MRRAIVMVILAAVPATGVVAQQSRADIDLQAAIRTETVDGDLERAIKLYSDVAERHMAHRSVAATALMRMAESYQKLGNDQARVIYERIVREFGDQSDLVTVARSRLTGTESRRAASERAVWTGPEVDVFGRVSPDGKWLTYVDWTYTGNVMVRDLEKGISRALTPKKSWEERGEGLWSAISRDGKMVVYGWLSDDRVSLRLAPIMSSPTASARELIGFSQDEVRFLNHPDWSPDGRLIALSLARADGTGQIALVSSADGSLRVLKSTPWKGPERLFFSPDGRYLAYDLAPIDGTDQREIFVLAVDGSRETVVAPHPAEEALLGWSPDNRLLLFTSNRTGTNGIWGVPIADGKPQGEPELLKAQSGAMFSLGLTAQGSLYSFRSIGTRDVRVAEIDLAAGRLLSAPRRFTEFVESPRNPDWSPDGKHLAIAACNGGAGNCVVIRNVETGKIRKVPVGILYAASPKWSPDGRALVTAGRDTRGRDGLFLIDAETGHTTAVLLGPALGSVPRFSSDGKRIYYRKAPAARGTIVERDLESGVERQVFSDQRLGMNLDLAPDGRSFASSRTDPATKTTSLVIIPVFGGEVREVLHLDEGEQFGTGGAMAWTPDGRAILFTKRTSRGPELWLAPLEGSARKLDISAPSWVDGQNELNSGFSLSPDGRQIAFLTGTNAGEVWATENFLPMGGKH